MEENVGSPADWRETDERTAHRPGPRVVESPHFGRVVVDDHLLLGHVASEELVGLGEGESAALSSKHQTDHVATERKGRIGGDG